MRRSGENKNCNVICGLTTILDRDLVSQGGEGKEILPTAILNPNLNKRPETSGLFRKFIWEQFDVVGYCSLTLMLPRQPVLVQFRRFSEVLGKSRYPTWRIQDGRHLTIMMSFQRHMTSSLLVGDVKGNIFTRAISPPSLINCHSFYTCEVMVGGTGGGGGGG